MTLTQIALAARADRTWILNTERLLGRRFPRSAVGARQAALLRTLHYDLGLPLQDSADAVGRLRASQTTGIASIRSTPDGSASVSLDMHRFASTFNAALAIALAAGVGKRRGRPRRASSDPARDAAGFGVDLSLLTLTLARSPAERLAALEANAALLVEIGSAR